MTGGHLASAVRVGDTVRRRQGPWTPAVHALLRYLEEAGFPAAPRVRGADERGREVLTFITGETVGRTPWPSWVWDDQVLVGTGVLLADFHRVVRGFRPASGTRWRHATGAPKLDEVVCHNDVGPQNMVFRDGKVVALIDWDWAQPAVPEWDLAHAAWLGVPLLRLDACRRYGITLSVQEQARRLRLLCDGYGLQDVPRLLELVVDRIHASIEWISSADTRGDHDLLNLERNVAGMRSTIAHIQQHERELSDAIGT